MDFIKDQVVIVTNPRHARYRRMGHVIVTFTNSHLAGKILVDMGTHNNLFNPWEIEDIREYNKRVGTNKVTWSEGVMQ